MPTCQNCCHEVNLKFCPVCGQERMMLPYTSKNIATWFKNKLDFNKGFFKTLTLLKLRPNVLINNFLRGKTKNIADPVQYLAVSVAFYLILLWLWKYSGHELHWIITDELGSYFLIVYFGFSTFLINRFYFLRYKLTSVEHLIISLYQSAELVYINLFSFGLVEISRSLEMDFDMLDYLWLPILFVYHLFFTIKVFSGSWIWSTFVALFSFVIFIFIVYMSMAYDVTGSIRDSFTQPSPPVY